MEESLMIFDQNPSDTISSIDFIKENYLLVSSWDKSVYLYDIEPTEENTNSTLLFRAVTDTPVLSAKFYLNGNHNVFVYGGLDKRLHCMDASSKKEKILGQHDDAIRAICCKKNTGLILSGSWDKTIKIWNLTAKNYTLSTINVSDRVHALNNYDNYIAAATGDKKLIFYDIRNLGSPLLEKKSPLNQTRCLEWVLKKEEEASEGIALGSTDGKVALEYIKPSETLKNYTFKCHRQNKEGKTFIYPVNALAVHPKYNTVATGGSDGKICIWDTTSKKRIFKTSFNTSISALAFNQSGNKLAIASSYIQDGGEHLHDGLHKIIIKDISDSLVRNKIIN